MNADVSALVVLVPKARALEPFRRRHDPSSALGVPAHVTVLSPFMTPQEIDEIVLDQLRRHFAAYRPFHYSLSAVRRFLSPVSVLYLSPMPDEPFRQLTLGIWQRYPNWPPYAGQHADIVPHMCLAQLKSAVELDGITDEFMRTGRATLPIDATAEEVTLMDKIAGRWAVRTTFKLGSD